VGGIEKEWGRGSLDPKGQCTVYRVKQKRGRGRREEKI